MNFCQDHPRGCGEHSQISLTFMSRPGSSPRMRGAPRPGGRVTVEPRIIPADAGSTNKSVELFTQIKDHPRGCGEHLAQVCASPYHQGSSPRMRGAPGDCRCRWCLSGIIPADAGSTRRMSANGSPARDHPRGCGEHPSAKCTSGRVRGSSPRMRGAPGPSSIGTWATRIIPADAGSTVATRPAKRASKDHPRGCGEHVMGS